CDYVGAYLNAARFGSDALKQRRSETDDEQWPPHFGNDGEMDAEDRQRLDAFGRSQSGWPLFPFNEAAVRQLSDIHLRDAEQRLRLNPRTIINHLLIRVLRDYRSAWLDNKFPSEEFLGKQAERLSASLVSEVRNAESSRETRSRYLALLRFWGDCPDRLGEAVLPKEVYEAFGLRPLTAPGPEVRPRFPERHPEPIPSNGSSADNGRDSDEPATPKPVQPEPMPVPAPVPEPIVTSEHPEEVRRWDRLLNGWNPSSILPQKEANDLRLMLANHVLGAIDWDAHFLRKLTAPEMKGWQGNIFLPNAKGTGNVTPANAMCTVCTNEEFASIDQRNTAVLALIALTRHEHYQNWDYPDAELDYACLQNLLERLVPQATEWLLSKKYHEFAGDPVPALVEHILLAARFLDVKTAHASDSAALLNALFDAPPDLESPQAGDEWAEFKSEAVKHHRLLQDELLARTAVRQGGAGTTHGIDCVRLLHTIRKFKGTSKSDTPMPDGPGSGDVAAAVTFAKRFSARLSSVVRNQQNRLASIRQQCLTELGEDFDQSGLVTTLKEQVLPEAQRLGVLAGDLPKAADLQRLCEEFRLARVPGTLKKLAATESDDFGTQVSSLAQIDNQVLGVIERFLRTMSDTLVALEKNLEAELAAGEGMLEASKERIEQTLDRMSEQLNVIGGSTT
ncbi:MAG: hypothetical protein O3A00_25495, partial [Planctomycetota bacterium]|nr:hypothetical protein [Planctomycetota bacterium]